MTSVRLLIADDHEIVRSGLRAVLEAQTGWMVVAEARDGKEAVEKAKQVKPHVADNGYQHASDEWARRSAANDPARSRNKNTGPQRPRSDSLIQSILQAGARGYLMKIRCHARSVVAVNALLRNKTFFTPKIEQMVLEGYRKEGAGYGRR